MADLFFIINNVDIANYADDNTPYAASDNINDLISSLEEASKNLFQWFDENLMKSNPDKCHLLLSTKEKVAVKINNFRIENSSHEKLLGIHFDNKLTFDLQISDMCKKASRKIYALARVTKYMNLTKRKTLMNAFFNSQFNYCPLIWMCHSRINNNKINRLHERCLRIIYKDKKSSFEELLDKDSSVSIHNRNMQILATELYKIKMGMSRGHMNEIFKLREQNPYNLRQNSDFLRPAVNTVFHGTESLAYLGPKIWDMVPDSFKEIDSIYKFKKVIRKWKPENCPCRICKVYIPHVGFT